MDYRKPLYYLEQWSPRIAWKAWGITSLSDVPLLFALGFRLKKIDDFEAELSIPKNHALPSVILAASEFGSKLLWRRHLLKGSEKIILQSIDGHFDQLSETDLVLRTDLAEVEREKILRKLRINGVVESEISIYASDRNGKSLALVTCKWKLLRRGAGLQAPALPSKLGEKT